MLGVVDGGSRSENDDSSHGVLEAVSVQLSAKNK
jgi:hypothetical protein